jgi:hypothetical protein
MDKSRERLDGEETGLRGTALGSERTSAVDQLSRARERNLDQQLRLDGEKDTLYDDGLEIDSDDSTLVGTDGQGPKGIRG